MQWTITTQKENIINEHSTGILEEQYEHHFNTMEENAIPVMAEEIEDDVHAGISGEKLITTSEKNNSKTTLHIKIIGPRHPMIIHSDINTSNILPYEQSIQAHITTQEKTP
ncbi:hypothetical protein O181_029936 [Austropuccinia psidii MF-1]|uniref:Uncharacterized protein n=1 Tax=Austropuccinia psidii MF-1 TaxID=1389203 RepID=A0A9Q3CXG9_9BASI|nr:hypothetical protein [Austropuccinia psidii MF-1]